MKPTPPESGQLVARGKDGSEVTYQYSCEGDTHLVEMTGYQTKPKWCFTIIEEDDVFNFDLVDEENFMRVEMMNRNGCERYKKRGITEAFIRLCHHIFGVPICSSIRAQHQLSSNGIASVAEQHSAGARKVWEGLVASGEAYFDNEKQRFTYPAVQL
jgi:hypothetical protein